jgi:hypothetical protein
LNFQPEIVVAVKTITEFEAQNVLRKQCVCVCAWLTSTHKIKLLQVNVTATTKAVNKIKI